VPGAAVGAKTKKGKRGKRELAACRTFRCAAEQSPEMNHRRRHHTAPAAAVLDFLSLVVGMSSDAPGDLALTIICGGKIYICVCLPSAPRMLGQKSKSFGAFLFSVLEAQQRYLRCSARTISRGFHP
jgi:hypothetical protein